MRKLIKVAPEHKNKLWKLFMKGIGRVGYFKNDLYELNERHLEYLRTEGIDFEIIEPGKWRWEGGRPVEKIDNV
ncbi:MAG: hypothetical protein QXI19_12645 [Candidatus Caldarchaeum sp.]